MGSFKFFYLLSNLITKENYLKEQSKFLKQKSYFLMSIIYW